MSYEWHDFVGNVGVVIILLAYLFLQLGRIEISDWRYSFANGIGALLILISLYFAFNLSSFVIEIAWLGISVFGLYKAVKAHH